MEHIWRNYSPAARFIATGAPASPKEEVQGPECCGRRLINPLPRFASIFLPLFQPGWDDAGLNRKVAENLLFHILANMDRLAGLHHHILKEEKIGRQLAGGACGQRIRDNYLKLAEPQRRLACALLRRQWERESRELLFADALAAFFPGSAGYWDAAEKRFLIFLPQEESQEAKSALELIEDLFCDITCGNKKYYWGRRFGIIGTAATMRIGHTTIY